MSITTELGIAHEVFKDEKALRISERNLMRPDSKGVNRYKLIYVIRNDKLAVYKEDMGPSESYRALEFEIWSGWQDSVSYLLDMADKQRNSDIPLPERFAKSIEDNDLIERYIAYVEQATKIAKNRSFSGPGGLRQRTGFHVRKD